MGIVCRQDLMGRAVATLARRHIGILRQKPFAVDALVVGVRLRVMAVGAECDPQGRGRLDIVGPMAPDAGFRIVGVAQEGVGTVLQLFGDIVVASLAGG